LKFEGRLWQFSIGNSTELAASRSLPNTFTTQLYTFRDDRWQSRGTITLPLAPKGTFYHPVQFFQIGDYERDELYYRRGNGSTRTKRLLELDFSMKKKLQSIPVLNEETQALVELPNL